MISRVHLRTMPLKLEQEIRRRLRDEGHPDDGCYVYIRNPDPKCTSNTPPLTEEDKKQIRRLYKRKKATANELAQLYGKTRQAIYQLLKETR